MFTHPRATYANGIERWPCAQLTLLRQEFQTGKSTAQSGVGRRAAFTLGSSPNFYFYIKVRPTSGVHSVYSAVAQWLSG